MIEVDLIERIRRAFHEERSGIKTIAREFGVSRTTVRKVVRSDKNEFRYSARCSRRPNSRRWSRT
jgi:DNA invertase Pin-like site-specific DNA recombinase